MQLQQVAILTQGKKNSPHKTLNLGKIVVRKTLTNAQYTPQFKQSISTA